MSVAELQPCMYGLRGLPIRLQYKNGECEREIGKQTKHKQENRDDSRGSFADLCFGCFPNSSIKLLFFVPPF